MHLFTLNVFYSEFFSGFFHYGDWLNATAFPLVTDSVARFIFCLLTMVSGSWHDIHHGDWLSGKYTENFVPSMNCETFIVATICESVPNRQDDTRGEWQPDIGALGAIEGINVCLIQGTP